MNERAEGKPGWKWKLGRELTDFSTNAAYLFLFFGVFTMYRRLVLAQYGISYFHYGYAFFKALILAKIIMIGDFFGLAQRLKRQPLIVTALYRAILFAVWVFLFDFTERLLDGLLRGKGLAGGIYQIANNRDELLAGVLVVFFAFIPFFAFKELGRVMGVEGKPWLFFAKRTALESELSLCKDK